MNADELVEQEVHGDMVLTRVLVTDHDQYGNALGRRWAWEAFCNRCLSSVEFDEYDDALAFRCERV